MPIVLSCAVGTLVFLGLLGLFFALERRTGIGLECIVHYVWSTGAWPSKEAIESWQLLDAVSRMLDTQSAVDKKRLDVDKKKLDALVAEAHSWGVWRPYSDVRGFEFGTV
jgi:hypothetical protein